MSSSNSKKPESPQSDQFVNVHEILHDAAAETVIETEEWVTQTFRMPKRLKKLTDEVCKSNGTDASKFYRSCAEALVKDYIPS